MKTYRNHEQWRAIGAVGLCVLLGLLALQLMGVRRSNFQQLDVMQLGDAAGPPSEQSSRHNLIAAAPQLAGRGSYQDAALANLKSYKNNLLSRMVSLFDSKINGTRGFTYQDWKLFEPIISCPPGRPLTRYGGTEDGAKLLCDMGSGKLPKTCIIYSMGSAGNYLFEEAMLAATSCTIHTFDCTVEGQSISPRHHYHKWCIGSGKDGRFRAWANVTTTLGHKHVDLLKIDIEGHEYPVLADLQPGLVLPGEISIEIHVRMSPQWKATHLEGSWQNGVDMPHSPLGLAMVFMHLAGLGYGVYSQDINRDWYMCCSEFSLLRLTAGEVQ